MIPDQYIHNSSRRIPTVTMWEAVKRYQAAVRVESESEADNAEAKEHWLIKAAYLYGHPVMYLAAMLLGAVITAQVMRAGGV